MDAHSISAGLDYPGVGPEHAYLRDTGRAEYVPCTDDEALAAFHRLCETEGIVPALESSHALARALDCGDDLVVVTGTTGARTELAPSLAPLTERARAVTDAPLYAGFGISTPEHARAAAELVDGIVVGSRAVEAAEAGAAELA